ncbi:MAG: hypothetical protein MI741_20555 [Rhodospirillales bacterium]|nr:hypothetical protein [Rhodospirillales bacterium]
MNRDLEQALSQWDGKSTESLSAIHDALSPAPDFADRLLALARKTEFAAGATWLLKRHLESGKSLSKNQIRALWSLAGGLEHWEAKLHVLQCLPFLPVEVSQKDQVAEFLRHCLGSGNKFVRAWAHGGFMELAGQHPEFEEETESHLRRATEGEAASVKARIRQAARNHPRWEAYART